MASCRAGGPGGAAPRGRSWWAGGARSPCPFELDGGGRVLDEAVDDPGPQFASLLTLEEQLSGSHRHRPMTAEGIDDVGEGLAPDGPGVISTGFEGGGPASPGLLRH